MQWYAGKSSKLSSVMHKKAVSAAHLILVFAIVGSLIISAALYSTVYANFWNALWFLKWGGVTMFICLLFVAIFGRYDRCLIPHKGKFWSYFSMVASSLVASIIGIVSLALVWKLSWMIKLHIYNLGLEINPKIAFTFLPPLILLAFGVMVVIRMALLGKYFPDERREWWGRMGAIINKWSLVSLVLTAAIGLGSHFNEQILDSVYLPSSLAGWLVLIGSTVKAAFSGQSSGKEETKGIKTTALEVLSRLGPYLFIIGLLIILSIIIDPLLIKIDYAQLSWLPDSNFNPLSIVLLIIIFGGIGFYLSRKLGVNEFSMHNFYRNRLVRAYLGASRTRDERAKTANPFTGFDKLDDLKLCTFTNDNGYYGPYLI